MRKQKTIWKHKSIAWKWLITYKQKFNKLFYFNITRVKNNSWLWRPRFFADINTPLFSFHRNNCELIFGIGFGKNHLRLHYHH